jgi:regulatory protein PHO2
MVPEQVSLVIHGRQRDSDVVSSRRAKAKLQDGKKGRADSAESPPDTPPELTTGYEAELHNLIHEDERKPCQQSIHVQICKAFFFCPH